MPAVTTNQRGNVVEFGQAVTVPAGQSVHNVVAAGGDVVVNGSVARDVVTFGGNVLIRGTVGGDVVAFGGNVHLAPSAVVGSSPTSGGHALVVFGGSITRDAGSQVNGSVRHFVRGNLLGSLGWGARHTFIRPWVGFTLIGWVVQTAIFLVLALVVAALMPNQLRAVQRHLAAKPAAALGWGALGFFVAVPAVLIVLVVSLVGLLLVLPYAVVVLLFYFFVITAVAAFIAERVLAGTQQKSNLMLAVTLGVVGTTIVSRIPVAGILALIVMAVFGIGAAAMALVEWRRTKKAAAAAAVPAGGPPAGATPGGGQPAGGPPAGGSPAGGQPLSGLAEGPSADRLGDGPAGGPVVAGPAAAPEPSA